jgi:serine/threonine-protein kinase
VSSELSADRTVARLVGGRYEITGLLASGGMGEVYAARDTVLDRRVALKLLRPSLGVDADFVERFRGEAMAAARLTHPNIVQVYDWGRSEDGSAYMAMEYVDGQNLREILSAKGRLRPSVAARISAQVCAALETARRAGIVHRDIKPENILVTPEGQVKVADFGLARALASSRATQAGVVLGTAAYLSPEQVEGRPTDHRADQYALGVMLYEMLAGVPPFRGDNPVVVAYKRVAEDVPSARATHPDVPEALDAIVARATARRPEDRFPSPGEMAAALRGAGRDSDTGELADLAHHTVAIPIATQETVALARRRTFRRRRLVALGIALALIAVAVPVAARIFARVTVPGVTRLTQDAAAGRLEAAGLTASPILANDPRVPQGQVISQDPPAGARVRKGAEVKLVISLGPELRTVPNVRNSKVADAARTLAAAGFVVKQVQAPSPTVPKDVVIDQDPDPNVRYEKGATVTITVSTGPKQIPVPNVVGRTEQEAKDGLTGAGFKVTVQRATSDTVAEGAVVSQTPAGGAKAAEGSAVTIVVSQGTPLVAVPDLRCKTRRQAADALAAAGLKADFKDSGTRVVDQEPGPGTQAHRGSTVRAFMGTGAYC